MAKMTEEELQKWDDLYKYVKFEILEYKESMNLPKQMIIKLKEIITGRQFARLDRPSLYEYTYDDVLDTFKFYKFKIKQAVANKTFTSEINKFGYIMAIVNNSINDVVLIKDQAKKLKEKTENQNLEYLSTNDSAEYKKKDGDNTNKKTKDLW